MNKKTAKPVRKLTLTRETLKRLSTLTESQLRQVGGGLMTARCNDGDPGYSYTQAPC